MIVLAGSFMLDQPRDIVPARSTVLKTILISHWEQHASLTFRSHQRHESGFARYRVFQFRELQQPGAAHWQIGHAVAL